MIVFLSQRLAKAHDNLCPFLFISFGKVVKIISSTWCASMRIDSNAEQWTNKKRRNSILIKRQSPLRRVVLCPEHKTEPKNGDTTQKKEKDSCWRQPVKGRKWFEENICVGFSAFSVRESSWNWRDSHSEFRVECCNCIRCEWKRGKEEM